MVREIALRAREAYTELAEKTPEKKDKFLRTCADTLEERCEEIIRENEKDLKYAQEKGLKGAIIDRLKLDGKRVALMSASLRDIASLPDPVGEIVWMKRRPNGMWVGKMRTPLGVIAVIYEARPNVTSDVAGLCVKSGNAVILRGGSEALNSNVKIVEIIRTSLREAGLPENTVQLIPDPKREHVVELIKLDNLIDILIPRGGEELIRFVTENAKVPVLKHFKGVCHIFIDKDADFEKAFKICLNAKVQRPSVCNAMETLLVHGDIAEKFLPRMAEIYKEHRVELRGCDEARKYADMKPATEEDWYAEYLDLILAVKVVKDVNEAMEHIRKYGSLHTEAIITENYSTAMKFISGVDSSTVLINASTRFSDGYEFGLGAEVGISTSKIHAYGPMGLEGLTTLKFVVFGSGQIRQ